MDIPDDFTGNFACATWPQSRSIQGIHRPGCSCSGPLTACICSTAGGGGSSAGIPPFLLLPSRWLYSSLLASALQHRYPIHLANPKPVLLQHARLLSKERWKVTLFKASTVDRADVRLLMCRGREVAFKEGDAAVLPVVEKLCQTSGRMMALCWTLG
jgi:hypothetical protein